MAARHCLRTCRHSTWPQLGHKLHRLHKACASARKPSTLHLWQGCVVVDLQEQWQQVAAKLLQQLWVLLQK